MINCPLVLATRNQGKIAEFKKLLTEFDIEIKSLADFGPIPEIIEDGKTFEDNAYKKASFTAKVLGFPTLADDSGLIVDALGGAPGVHSARYAGAGATDAENMSKLLEDMKDVIDRRAAFQAVIIIAVPRGSALTYEGRCEGEITHVITGENGFGYDPVFYYPPLKKTFAQMSQEEKNRVSHRGKAMSEIRDEFDKIMIWLQNRLVDEPFYPGH